MQAAGKVLTSACVTLRLTWAHRGCGYGVGQAKDNYLITEAMCTLSSVFSSNRALFTYEGNTNDIRVAGKGGD